MRLDKAAMAMLRVTALAWSIPFAQSAESPQPDSMDVSVETFDNRVLLSTVAAVQGVKDGLATRK